jgi:hypothetical protein
MNPEAEAWQRLCEQAEARLSGDFADRVIRAARQQVESAPSLAGQFMLTIATAALCFLAVAFFNARESRAQDTRSLADWQQIASAVDDSNLAE